MMEGLSHIFASVVLVGLLCLGAPPSAIGCSFHSLEIEFETMYPGSLPVAVALRSAADRGVIDAAALEAPGNGTASYDDTVRRLQEFGRILAASSASAELPSTFSLGYVESQLWTRYSQSAGEIGVDVHTSRPAAGETVVLTGEPVMTEVLAGRLSVDRALADGLILIDGNARAKASIRHALNATATPSRISSR